MKRKDVFVSAIKGIITGITTWINNMSVASVILSLNSYENVIKGLSNSKNKKNQELWYVTIPLLFSICLGLLGGHKLMNMFLKRYQLQTIILFIGLFIGGIKVVFTKKKLNLNKKNIYIPIVIILISVLFIILTNNKSITVENNIIKTIVLGLLAGISILLPGTSILSSKINCNYTTIINSLTNITKNKNSLTIILFLIVVLITILLISKIIAKLINKNKNNLYISLCSLIVVSIIILISEIKPTTLNFVNVFTSILAFLWGYIFAKNVERE